MKTEKVSEMQMNLLRGYLEAAEAAKKRGRREKEDLYFKAFLAVKELCEYLQGREEKDDEFNGGN